LRVLVKTNPGNRQWSLIPRKNSGHVYSSEQWLALKIFPTKVMEFLPYFAGKRTIEPVFPEVLMQKIQPGM